MTDDLPNDFDLVVIGTGFPESCLAAAASRIGKTVLHIDENEYYGGTWSSFSLKNFNELLEKNSTNEGSEVRNARSKWHIENFIDESPGDADNNAISNELSSSSNDEGSSSAANKTILWNRDALLKESKRFNIDLCPKVLYSSGKLVQLLITSNICRYAEFRAIDHVCALYRGQLLSVPCSRSDVFNTKVLNVVEKRLLMKFLSTCIAYGEGKLEDDSFDYRNKTFHEYLKAQNLTEKISSCVMQSIAMCNLDTPFEQGMTNTKMFLQSLGRYGNTPFIFPMYGCGEIPQCFCRLCAVFGGTYCLKQKVNEITLSSGEPKEVLLTINDKVVRARNVVASHSKAPQLTGKLQNKLSRGVFIATSGLFGEGFSKTVIGGVNLMRLMAEDAREAILIQLSHFTGTCPKDTYLFHLTTESLSDDPEKDLEAFTKQIFCDDNNAPKILFSAYFTLTANCSNSRPDAEQLADQRVWCTSGPFYELDYDESINDAQSIFTKLYPNAEFLPRAPDPEEIVIDGEDPRALNEVSLPDDLREQLRELEKSAETMEIEDINQQQDDITEPKDLNSDAAFEQPMDTI